MSSIEEILWNIFTFYSLTANPKDPYRIHYTALLKICKDILAMDASMTENALTQADLHIIYTSTISSPSKKNRSIGADKFEKSDKVDFEAFLSCLIKISQKCYPSCQGKEESMQQLLMDNVLPLAARRKPYSISQLLKQPHIEAILKYYEDALKELYKFYTTSSDIIQKGKNMASSLSHRAETFDQAKEMFDEAKIRTASHDLLYATTKMGYGDFMRFANDFGLISNLGVTTLDLGDIYLTITYFSNFVPRMRKLEFHEFWEAIVRLALVAFQSNKSLNTETKIKGLFLSIWRHIQSSLQDHMTGYGTLQGGGFNTYKGALLRGTQILNEKFIAAWRKDNYCDYLSPLVAPSPPKAMKGETNKPTTALTPPRAAVATSTTLSTLLKSGAKSSSASTSAATATITGNTGSTKSQPPPSSSSSHTSSNNHQQEDIPELFKDKSAAALFQNDNFVITLPAPTNAPMRVMISDYDEFDDERLTAKDMRKLLFSKPAIAELLYEAMLDIGLVDEEIPMVEDSHAMQEQKGGIRGQEDRGEEEDDGSEQDGSRGSDDDNNHNRKGGEGPVTFRPSFLFNQPITVNTNGDMSDEEDHPYPHSDEDDEEGDEEDEDEDALLERLGHGLHLHDLRDD